jgi:DNA-directed RNA polymerase specialized sigma24 family protein
VADDRGDPRGLAAGEPHPRRADGSHAHRRDTEGELPEPAAAEPSTDEQAIARIDHAQRVADLRTLKARERRDLYLQALGYRYKEIARLSGAACVAAGC